MKVIFTSRSIRPTDVSWPCHALFGSTKCLRKFIKSVGSLPSAYSKEKELSDKYLRKKGAALPRPSGWIDIMSKSFKNILDYSLLIAKIIMKKYSSVFL